jgi:hypothetical protein
MMKGMMKGMMEKAKNNDAMMSCVNLWWIIRNDENDGENEGRKMDMSKMKGMDKNQITV